MPRPSLVSGRYFKVEKKIEKLTLKTPHKILKKTSKINDKSVIESFKLTL